MKKLWCDLETFSTVPITSGSHAYAEGARVLLFAYAIGDDEPEVWDVDSGADVPDALQTALNDPECEMWFHNGGMFDFVVLRHTMPDLLARVDMSRWRDTMVQAYCHALPGSLDALGGVLGLADDKKKLKEGRALVHLFCKPQNDAFEAKYGTRIASVATHPAEWARFVEYAKGDIIAMREVHNRMPMWNYTGKQVDLWHTDLKINYRGFTVDEDLARMAITAVEDTKRKLAARVNTLTSGAVDSATQRDAMLRHILLSYGVELPDLRADTIERRINDPDLPEIVKELLRIRLVASMNSVSKYRTLLNAVSSDGRIRGGAQYRGAGRTGRYAHRLFQHGNMPRPTIPQALIEAGIEIAKSSPADLYLVIGDEIVQWASSAIRSTITAGEGKTLAVADLANIEGRVAAWLAEEEWKLQAFRDFDTVTGTDEKGKQTRKGADLYIVAYANSFNVPIASVPPKGDERQIGKVQELMFQYGGGVGAWLTGAATYGIDLNKMTDQVYPVLPAWAVEKATSYAEHLVDTEIAMRIRAGTQQTAEDESTYKSLMHLPFKTFVTCDAIKRLWRHAHPKISSYWSELEDAVRAAVASPKTSIVCRKVTVRRSGSWLRIKLPSGRQLCYPSVEVDDEGTISYAGVDPYTTKWGRVKTYGGKLFENITQAVAADQLVECFPLIEAAGYEINFHVHDEVVAEVDAQYTAAHTGLAALMCSGLGWNAGLPLAAAGFTAYRYKKD